MPGTASWRAARLYRQGSAAHILLSGGNITWLGSRSATPAQDMAELLGWTGVFHPRRSGCRKDLQNTAEDALYSCRMLKEKGIRRVVLVTSAMHMPRSVTLFQHQGIEVIPAPAD